MTIQLKRIKTHRDAQFHVAEELRRRGYRVPPTLGNAPMGDLLAVSPEGKQFKVAVKGLSTKNFWLSKGREPKDELFYVLVYIPIKDFLRFFVMSSDELMYEREEFKKDKERRTGKYREELGGFNWSKAIKYENKWDKLPT